jgi:hypothetical protein
MHGGEHLLSCPTFSATTPTTSKLSMQGFMFNAEHSSLPPLEASSLFCYIIVFFFKEEIASREF